MYLRPPVPDRTGKYHPHINRLAYGTYRCIASYYFTLLLPKKTRPPSFLINDDLKTDLLINEDFKTDLLINEELKTDVGRDLQTQIPTAKIGAAIFPKQGWRQEGHPVFLS